MPAEVDVAALRDIQPMQSSDMIAAGAVVLPYLLWRDILAALERAERLDAALRELVRRAADPTLREGAFGAWVMLDAGISEATAILEGRNA